MLRNTFLSSVNSIQEYYQGFGAPELKNAPEHLYFEGDFSLLVEGKRASVVGSREATPEGLLRAEAITKTLVDLRIIVVSGLAKGIDTIAHKTAIKYGGRTIAVLGTPLSKAYPAENRELLDEIKRNHLAISQFKEGGNYDQRAFPMRNRTMALITDATIIIEASETSGTRHQGWEALRLGRSVFLLANVANDPKLSWPSEMVKYGAQVLTKENYIELLSNIPSFTNRVELSF